MSDRRPGESPDALPDPDGYFLPAGAGSHHEIFPGVEIRTTAGRGLMFSVVHLGPDPSWPSTPIPTSRWASSSKGGSSSPSAA